MTQIDVGRDLGMLIVPVVPCLQVYHLAICGNENCMITRATTLYPFVPSGPEFEQAMAFFAALGFEVAWRQEGVAGLRFGGAYFILQDIDVPEWQTNQMITFEVDDLDRYWQELAAQNLADRFAGVKLKPPTAFPWGREMHIIDPGGVCWHVRQAIGRP